MRTKDLSRDTAIEAIDLDAYLHRCKCPICGNHIFHGYDDKEVIRFCEKCGQKLHIRAFTKDEVDDALFEREQDEYED